MSGVNILNLPHHIEGMMHCQGMMKSLVENVKNIEDMRNRNQERIKLPGHPVVTSQGKSHTHLQENIQRVPSIDSKYLGLWVLFPKEIIHRVFQDFFQVMIHPKLMHHT
jgi:hypothetical protein